MTPHSYAHQVQIDPNSGAGTITVHMLYRREDGKSFAKPLIWPHDHPNFEKVKEALNESASAQKIADLMDTVTKVQAAVEGIHEDLVVTRNEILFEGKPLHLSICDRILAIQAAGLPIGPLTRFLSKLLANHHRTAVESLYEFMEKNSVPIMEDGRFMAFKKVRQDYKDCHSGTFDNSVGQIVKIKPWQVDENRDNECSNGLHVCGRRYLPSFGGDRIVIVAVDPGHVIAVPRDYNASKMRVFRYEVIGELTEEGRASDFDNVHVLGQGQDVNGSAKWGENFRAPDDFEQGTDDPDVASEIEGPNPNGEDECFGCFQKAPPGEQFCDDCRSDDDTCENCGNENDTGGTQCSDCDAADEAEEARLAQEDAECEAEEARQEEERHTHVDETQPETPPAAPEQQPGQYGNWRDWFSSRKG